MRKKIKTVTIIYILSAIVFLGVLSGCGNKNITDDKENSTVPKASGFTNITPEEAKRRLDSEKNIILIDVRTNEEYETGHITSAVLIPVDRLEQEANSKLQNKDTPIFVYCRSGSRSTAAANILVKQGYKNVYNLGGIINWPYEVVSQ